MAEPSTCATCGGTGLVEGELCSTCYGEGSTPIRSPVMRFLKEINEKCDKIDNIKNKCNDIKDKCDAIFEKVS